MPRDFFPRREFDVLSFSRNFKEKISAQPQDYGISPSQAAQYGAKHDAFAALLAAARDTATRTRPVVSAKTDALKALEGEARLLARIIRANPDVTSAMRIDLGLSPSDGGRGAPTHAPEAAPGLRIVGITGRTVHVRVSDSSVERRGKADGAAGVMIFACVGEHPAASLGEWPQKITTGRVTADVTFDSSLAPGTKVWLTAAWFGPRFDRGPCAAPLSAHLQYGVNVSDNVMNLAA